MISDSGFTKTLIPSPCIWTFWRWYTDVIHNRLETFDKETFCRVCSCCYAQWYNCTTFRFYFLTHTFCIFVALPEDVEADTSKMVLCSRCSDITSAANPLNATKLPSAAHSSTPPLKAIELPSAAHPSTQPLKATKLPSAAHPPSSTPPLKVTKLPSAAHPSTQPLKATKSPSAAHPSTQPLKATKLPSAAHPSTQPLKVT